MCPPSNTQASRSSFSRVPPLGALHVNVRTSRGDAEAASASSQHDVLPRRRGPARRTRRGARSPSIFLGAIRLGFVRLVRRSKPRRPALPEQCMRHPPLSNVRLPLSINFRRSSVPRQQPDAAPFSLRPSVTFVDEALTTTRLRSACPSSLPLPRFVRPAWSASTARQSASSAPLTARSNSPVGFLSSRPCVFLHHAGVKVQPHARPCASALQGVSP